MTGYEKSPDYARSLTWRGRLGLAAFIAGVLVIPVYLVFGPT